MTIIHKKLLRPVLLYTTHDFTNSKRKLILKVNFYCFLCILCHRLLEER